MGIDSSYQGRGVQITCKEPTGWDGKDLMQELGVIRQKVDVGPYVDLGHLDAAKKRF
jgi:hypothetical protein